MPIAEKTIHRILCGEMTEHKITAEGVQLFESGDHYIRYVASAIIRPQYRIHFRMLLKGIREYWCSLS